MGEVSVRVKESQAVMVCVRSDANVDFLLQVARKISR